MRMNATGGPLVAALVLACGGGGSQGGAAPELAREVPEPSGEAAPAGARISGSEPMDVLASELCQGPSPGSAPLRRLSNQEYRNAVADAFGLAEARVGQATASFPSETESLGFRNGADTLLVTRLIADNYQQTAFDLAPDLVGSLDDLDCFRAADGDSSRESSCVERVVTDVGQRLYRRPLSDAEKNRYLDLYATGRAGGAADDALSWVVAALLQSPHFLYRVEPRVGAQPIPVDDFSLASRLSFLIWQSGPDSTLLDLAARGALANRRAIREQVDRMLREEKALRLLEFFRQWLDLDAIAQVTRDPVSYPRLKPNLGELFRAESEMFLRDLIQSPAGDLDALLAGGYTFANAELAEHYGLENPPAGDVFERVDAPGRSGVLTSGMLTVRDKRTRSSIVARGLKVRTDLLCQLVPAPPDDVDLTLGALSADLTQQERLEQHRSEPRCAGCHVLMDPIGIVFEGFDAVGRPREVDERGAPVSTAGELTLTRDVNGPVVSVPELGETLASSEEVRECVMTQMFRFFYGRDLEHADLCSQAQLMRAFQESDYNVRELIIALTTTDAFLYVGAGEEDE